MDTTKLHVLLAFLFVPLLLISCTRKPTSTAEVPTVLSHAYSISVAPFTQPISPSDLITGNLPKVQGRISEEDLARLDSDLRAILLEGGKRHCTFLSSPLKAAGTHIHHGAQPDALSAWLAYGRQHKADLLLVPMVIDWHEREGSRAGVTESAMVRVEFFLLRVAAGSVMNRSVYEEKQEALVDNFLNIASFIKRRGAWVSARDLADEGMRRAKREFGL